MVQRILLFVVIIAMFSACGGGKKEQKTSVDSVANVTEKLPTISPDDFEAKAKDFVGKKISITGTVNHTCRESGGKMFIFGKNPDKTVKIFKSESMPKFESTLEGSVVEVVAVVKETVIDEKYLADWEKEVKAGKVKEHKGGKDKEEQKHGGEHASSLTQIKNLRDSLKKAKVDKLSFYSLECEKFVVKK